MDSDTVMGNEIKEPEFTTGTLRIGEPHPAAFLAREWLAGQDSIWLLSGVEALASTALAGNRSAQICGETLRRLLNQEPVSDSYLLGLVWFLRSQKP